MKAGSRDVRSVGWNSHRSLIVKVSMSFERALMGEPKNFGSK